MDLNRINDMTFFQKEKNPVPVKKFYASISLTQEINLGQAIENMEHTYLSL